MDKKLRKSLLAAAVVGALAVPMAANAAINFDTNGTGAGGQITIDQFNWGNQSVLAQGFFSGDTPPAGVPLFGTLYGHGQLTSASLGGVGQPGVPGGSAGNPVFTYQFSLEVSALIKKTAQNTVTYSDLAIVPSGATNFFRMYYDPTSEVSLSLGTGFGSAGGGDTDLNQVLILSGKLNLAKGQFQHQDGAVDGITPDQPLNNTSSPDPAGPWSIGGNGSINMNIDICSAAEVLNPLNLKCFGNAPDTVDANFFPMSTLNALTVDMNLNGGIQAPYEQFVPPAAVLGNVPNFGTPVAVVDPDTGLPVPGLHPINNFTCDNVAGVLCDMLYQGQNGLSTLNGTSVPEPGALALMGLGLAGLGFNLRRTRSKKV